MHKKEKKCTKNFLMNHSRMYRKKSHGKEMIGNYTFSDEIYSQNPVDSITSVVLNNFRKKKQFFDKLDKL